MVGRLKIKELHSLFSTKKRKEFSLYGIRILLMKTILWYDIIIENLKYLKS